MSDTRSTERGERVFRFNVREVTDRTFYVLADTYAEARKKLDDPRNVDTRSAHSRGRADVWGTDVDPATYRRTVRPLDEAPDHV